MARSTEIDAQLMDFLYGELSEDDADRFRERLAKDPELSAEVEAFQRTREAFKALPVEEPPPAVSAQLLHEAAKRAPAKRAQPIEERPGFWAAVVEWFQPLLRHPAAASIAALLLVGGVAGALYLRGVDSPAHPTARSEAPAPTAATAADRGAALEDGKDVAGEGAVARLDGMNLETAPQAGYVDGLVGADENDNDLRARLAEPEQEKALQDTTTESQKWSMNKRDEGRAALSPKPSEPLANAVSGADPLIVPEEPAARPADKLSRDLDVAKPTGGMAGKKAEREQVFEEKSVARQAPLRKSKEAAPGKAPATQARFSDDDGDAAEQIALEPQAAPPPSSYGSTSSVTRGGAGGGGSGYRVYKNRKDDQWAASEQGKLNRVLDKKITKKNRSKLCNEAAQLANDILDRNPEYYYAKVEGSVWLKPCTGFVAQETQSRARKRAGGSQRANAAKKRAKSKAGAPTKAKAAPAEDAAVEAE